MNDRIRVLAIAPYEGMKQLMTAMANDYPQIDLTVFVGDREQGLQIAKDNFHGNYDAVVSRGGTAFMLRQDLRVPVDRTVYLRYSLRSEANRRNGR